MNMIGHQDKTVHINGMLAAVFFQLVQINREIVKQWPIVLTKQAVLRQEFVRLVDIGWLMGDPIDC